MLTRARATAKARMWCSPSVCETPSPRTLLVFLHLAYANFTIITIVTLTIPSNLSRVGCLVVISPIFALDTEVSPPLRLRVCASLFLPPSVRPVMPKLLRKINTISHSRSHTADADETEEVVCLRTLSLLFRVRL